MNKILYINTTVRTDSRTDELTGELLKRLHGEVTIVHPDMLPLPMVDEGFLAKRTALCKIKDFSDPMFDAARQFAQANTIVISAPFWDLSFPASLKRYFEHINVIGLTFAYSPTGVPYGLCKAKDLYYVTTAGGYIASYEYGYGYVKALAETFYGIPKCHLLAAEGLDVYGADVPALLSAAMEHLQV